MGIDTSRKKPFVQPATPSRRRTYKWVWGDPGILDAKREWALYIMSEKRTVMHPQLRQKAHHDLRWETYGHEALHAMFPAMGHARIMCIAAAVGWFLHDFAGCLDCTAVRPRR